MPIHNLPYLFHRSREDVDRIALFSWRMDVRGAVVAVNYDLVRHDYNGPAAWTVLFVDLNPTGNPFSTRPAARISQQTLGNAGINVLVRDTNTYKRWASGPTKAAITLSRMTM